MALGRWLAMVGKLAVAAAVAAAGVYGLMVYRDYIDPALQIRHLTMEGVAEGSASAQELQECMQNALEGKNFLIVHLGDIKAAAEGISWVRRASVSRIWPDGIRVSVERHEPVALWEDGRLVSSEGVLFTSSDVGIERISSMPNFSGDENMLPMIVQLWGKFNDSTQRIGMRVKSVQVSILGSWLLVLESEQRPDVIVELGRSKVRAALVHKLDQVIEYFQKISDMMQGYPTYLDARYRNAFAARLPDEVSRESWEIEKGLRNPPELDQEQPEEEEAPAGASSPAQARTGNSKPAESARPVPGAKAAPAAAPRASGAAKPRARAAANPPAQESKKAARPAGIRETAF
jgi:cell division protein FtsQ